MPNYKLPSGKWGHRELTDFSFERTVRPKTKKFTFGWLYLIIALLFVLAFIIDHVTTWTAVPVAHASTVQVPMTDLQTYKFWDKNTKSLCKTYLTNH